MEKYTVSNAIEYYAGGYAIEDYNGGDSLNGLMAQMKCSNLYFMESVLDMEVQEADVITALHSLGAYMLAHRQDQNGETWFFMPDTFSILAEVAAVGAMQVQLDVYYCNGDGRGNGVTGFGPSIQHDPEQLQCVIEYLQDPVTNK